MEKRQSDMERFRVSSPVRKARQESARLSSAFARTLSVLTFIAANIIMHHRNSKLLLTAARGVATFYALEQTDNDVGRR